MLLHIENLVKTFATPANNEPLTVLNGLNLSVNAGAALAVVGPSGSGKSTLLNLIGGLDQPDSGEIRFNGEHIADYDEARRARWRNEQIGFVFQEHHLLPHSDGAGNVLMPTLAFRKTSPDDAQERAGNLLESVGLAERQDHHPAQLSGGEKQRTALVRALINRPRLLLADEPTGSLDQDTAAALADLLVQLNEQEGTALIMVTHSLDLARRMNTVYRLTEGRLQEGASV
ncbi:MAG: ABC transporter ATP-binding protein [candidate division KSB1 bacterium]|nr:ABC transporter ATP-binding protein [candidate division KSB1 bacterium]